MCLPQHVLGGQMTTLCWFLLPPCLRQDILWFPTSCARLADPRTSGNPPASHLSVIALGNTGTYDHTWLSKGSEDLNSDSQAQ